MNHIHAVSVGRMSYLQQRLAHITMGNFEACPNRVPYDFSTPQHLVNLIHAYHSLLWELIHVWMGYDWSSGAE